MFVSRTRRSRNQRGVAFPSPLVMLSIIAIAMAGFAFVATRDAGPVERKVTPAAATSTQTPEPTPVTPTRTAKPTPTIKRGEVYVEVFNNSGIKGLAATIAAKATQVGWQVVGEDNWYGAIPASTVYYPDSLHSQAKQLGKVLHITRVRPAVSPMQFDRLTVILTTG